MLILLNMLMLYSYIPQMCNMNWVFLMIYFLIIYFYLFLIFYFYLLNKFYFLKNNYNYLSFDIKFI